MGHTKNIKCDVDIEAETIQEKIIKKAKMALYIELSVNLTQNGCQYIISQRQKEILSPFS